MGESGSGGRLAGPGGDEEEPSSSTVTDGSSSRLPIRSSSDGRALRRLIPKPSMQNSFLFESLLRK